MANVPELAGLAFAGLLQEHSGDLEPGQDYDMVHFAGGEYVDAPASSARFTECAFTNVTFTEGRFCRARFNDVWMGALRLVGTDLAEADWLDITIRSSVLAGVAAFSSRLRRVVFHSCKLNAVNFRAGDLSEVTFQDCLLQEVDFNGAKLTNVTFPGTTLSRVTMDKVTLSKVDFTGATGLGLASGCDSLRGATISTAQMMQLAPVLVESLGITVKD